MFKVGDIVRVVPHQDTQSLFHLYEGTITTMREDRATVRLSNFRHPLYEGDEEFVFINASERLELIAAATAKEKPCQVCTRLNDAEVSICWLCGNKPF